MANNLFVADRYELLMTASVRLPESFEKIDAVLTTPQFDLHEVSAITNDGFGTGLTQRGRTTSVSTSGENFIGQKVISPSLTSS